jgi:hypothetical protein
VEQNLHDSPLSGQYIFLFKLRNSVQKITSLYHVLNRINSLYSPLINSFSVNVTNNYIIIIIIIV